MSLLGVAAALDAAGLHGVTFACLEGCGFCCTFTPEVTEPELARLRRAFPRLPVAREAGRMHVAFQGGCGACALLKDRRCTAYGDRPSHCRYFPFHVHFGPGPQAVVNRSCRGVAEAAGASLEPAFRSSVLDVVPKAAWMEHERQARSVYREFESNARAAGAWADLGPALDGLLAHPSAWLRRDGWPGGDPDEAWQAALSPFGEPDPVARPYYLAEDLRWLTFAPKDGGMDVLTLSEAGALAPVGAVPVAPVWQDPPPQAQAGLGRVLEALARRGVFFGQAAFIVDDLDYGIDVATGAAVRLAEMAADLAVRSHVLAGMGIPAERLADEAWRFYDSAWLDHPTIGGWL